MSFKFEELLDKLIVLKGHSFNFSIGLKSPLDHATMNQGFEIIQKAFPPLTESSYEDSSQTMFLSPSKDSSTQLLFRTIEQRRLSFSWGPEVELHHKELIHQLLGLFREGFGIRNINIEYADFGLAIISDIPCNHYLAIRNAFYKETPLGHLFEGDKFFDNDISMRGEIGNNTPVSIVIRSNVSVNEVKTGIFKNDILSIFLMLAIFYINADSDLPAEILNLIEQSEDFIADTFLPKIINPLDQELEKLSAA